MGCRQIKLHPKEKKVVFIEERHNYLSTLPEQSKQTAFFRLVFDETYQVPLSETAETDNIYYSSIQSIKRNSKEEFNRHYNKISKRKISENSIAPFIHDDFLIFTLIIGVRKFDCQMDWLLDVIRKRAKSTITTTFENLLIGNYQSKVNIQSIVLVFLFLLDKSKLNNEHLLEAYKAITNTHQSYHSDFIRIIHYRAFDIVIQLKLPREMDDVSRLIRFETRFKKRIRVFTYFAYNLFLILILFGAYKVLRSLPEDKKLIVNDLNLIIGLAAVIGLSGNFFPRIKKGLLNLMLKIFGYKN